ncbi:unnamed protein product [Parnassius apollo]|uniref:(apollo) hypothetical protein n=1 Tax=Parnassius apollo TaxID=110799 RepID=A0A8S3WIB5_PARAO|nr:unnamed protein product [Parnassius apollo]
MLVAVSAARSAQTTVVQMQLEYNEEYVLQLNDTVEYILDFTPPATTETEAGSSWPTVLRVNSSGGDLAQPVLLTSRLRAGAITWQLPYESDSITHFELERTLCPDDTAELDPNSDCGARPGGSAGRGAFSLHVTSSCGALLLHLEARWPQHWRLPFLTPVHLAATQISPRVFHYQFEEGQQSVRLVVESDDDICASISIQNYSCPIAQTPTEISNTGLRMTVLRSGAVHLSRRRYPRGFLVVAVVLARQEACGEVGTDDSAWLWAAAVLGEQPAHQVSQPRTKLLTFTVEASLSRTQYAVAIGSTTALFLAFYVAFGVLVLAQRWPPFLNLVRPAAVLVDTSVIEEAVPTQNNGDPATSTPTHRRRVSNVTFDSSDGSSSEEELDPAPASPISPVSHAAPTIPAALGAPDPSASPAPSPHANGDTAPPDEQRAGPFGLPAQLRLAALARRRERTLRARSDRYLYTLVTVAVFYALPVVQFVAVIQLMMNVSGSLDTCYYNFLCAHPAGLLHDFNHVFSNAGYLLLGALFLLQVQRRRARRRRHPRHQDYGIPAHYGLLSALGAAMMVVALMSASYHVCPNRLNFQFDTAFMYVLAVLSMVKVYQSRHPDVNARAHSTFAALAVIIAIVVWGVLGGGGPLLWGVWSALHVATFLLLSLRIYYVGQFRLEKESVAEAAREMRRSARPLYSARLALLLLANALNWMLAAYGLVRQTSDFAGHMLQVLLGNTLLYMAAYLVLKLVQGERLRWYAWCWLAGATAAWLPAIYFFLAGSADWADSPARSRLHNHRCKVMQFYDSHDLWHMLSAVALYFTFNVMLTWDDGLSAVKRSDIPVF